MACLGAALLLAATAAASEGRPLFYWGARAPVVVADAPAGAPANANEARVLEVHAARDKDDVVIRFSFDRPVREALRLADGTPVSGRLSAVLYLDCDDDRGTGLEQGSADIRSGADRRLEIGTIAMGADDEEQRKAGVVVSATLSALAGDGRRRTLLRSDEQADPKRVSAHGEWVEVRLPASVLQAGPALRLILASGDRLTVGRLEK